MIVPQLSMHSPLGDLTVTEEDGSVVALDWGWGRDQATSPLLQESIARLHAYFDGALIDFSDLSIRPKGSAYQRAVWAELRKIRRGDTKSYGQIATLAGGSARSVGQANRANPAPILIPCHRVVAAHGLGGYSGCMGLETKRHLLLIEQTTDGMAHRA